MDQESVNKNVLDILFKVEIKEDMESKEGLYLIEITEEGCTHYEYGFVDEEDARAWIRDAVTLK